MTTLYQYCDKCKSNQNFTVGKDEITCKVCNKKHKYDDKKVK